MIHQWTCFINTFILMYPTYSYDVMHGVSNAFLYILTRTFYNFSGLVASCRCVCCGELRGVAYDMNCHLISFRLMYIWCVYDVYGDVSKSFSYVHDTIFLRFLQFFPLVWLDWQSICYFFTFNKYAWNKLLIYA